MNKRLCLFNNGASTADVVGVTEAELVVPEKSPEMAL
jgi:hypothetical protein